MSKIRNLDEIISEANEIHNNKYEYVRETYKGVKYSMDIICPVHGKFSQIVYKHVKQGYGCPKCGIIKCANSNRNKKQKINDCHKVNFEEFVHRANEKHCGKFTYDEKSFKNMKTLMNIYCEKHGWFKQTPSQHLKTKFGCKCCSDEYNSKRQFYTFKTFVEIANNVHNNKYLYDENFGYENWNKKIPITCKEHGIFWQTPNEHLQGYGCPKCGHIKHGLKQRMPLETFLKKAKIVHGEKYSYDNIEIPNSLINSNIYPICPTHGKFKVNAQYHLDGVGCPFCSESKLERVVRVFLEKKAIQYVYEQKFDWLVFIGKMSLDFYLPDYNIAIECQGEQHYRPVNFGGCCDEIAKHNIPLIYINNNDDVETILDKYL